jgi:hypothetical protein
MTSRQQRRAAERAQRKQARREARQTTASEPRATGSGVSAVDPITRDRAAINRQNAEHSTGPKTVAGKANSSRNSFKHGLYSQELVTSDEEASALDALKADLRNEHQPVNLTEEILVNEMAEQFWRLRRARGFEANLLDNPLDLSRLAAVQRMMSSAERGFHKALATLRQFQKERGFVPQATVHQDADSENGFVPQNAPSPEIGFESQNDNAPVTSTLPSRDREGAVKNSRIIIPAETF